MTGRRESIDGARGYHTVSLRRFHDITTIPLRIVAMNFATPPNPEREGEPPLNRSLHPVGESVR